MSDRSHEPLKCLAIANANIDRMPLERLKNEHDQTLVEPCQQLTREHHVRETHSLSVEGIQLISMATSASAEVAWHDGQRSD